MLIICYYYGQAETVTEATSEPLPQSRVCSPQGKGTKLEINRAYKST